MFSSIVCSQCDDHSQRATFEILAKRYVYVVGEDSVIHQREISILTELDDVFVLRDGLKAGERIILEGVRQVATETKSSLALLNRTLFSIN